LRALRLPAYSPDFNADEHVWGRTREAGTADSCFGTAPTVRAHVDAYIVGCATRHQDVQQRRRTVLQANADALGALARATAILHPAHHSTHADADPTLA
jgi:hypothetical protein